MVHYEQFTIHYSLIILHSQFPQSSILNFKKLF